MTETNPKPITLESCRAPVEGRRWINSYDPQWDIALWTPTDRTDLPNTIFAWTWDKDLTDDDRKEIVLDPRWSRPVIVGNHKRFPHSNEMPSTA